MNFLTSLAHMHCMSYHKHRLQPPHPVERKQQRQTCNTEQVQLAPPHALLLLLLPFAHTNTIYSSPNLLRADSRASGTDLARPAPLAGDPHSRNSAAAAAAATVTAVADKGNLTACMKLVCAGGLSPCIFGNCMPHSSPNLLRADSRASGAKNARPAPLAFQHTGACLPALPQQHKPRMPHSSPNLLRADSRASGTDLARPAPRAGDPHSRSTAASWS